MNDNKSYGLSDGMINETKRVLQLINMLGQTHRRIGRTRAIVNAALDLDATVLCVNTAHARSVTELCEESTNIRGVKTASVHAKLNGVSGPFLFDHFTHEMIANDALQAIKTLEAKCLALEVRVQELNQELKMEMDR